MSPNYINELHDITQARIFGPFHHFTTLAEAKYSNAA